MFPLFESIKIINGVPQHLYWHQSRVNASYEAYFSKPVAPALENLLWVPEEYRTGIFKCRFSYNRSTHTMEFSKYIPKKIAKLKIVEGEHIDYSLKYADRNSLEQLLELKENCDEILIVKANRITDTSFSNIVLFDGQLWITPKNPLLEGTCRNRLISEGKIVEAEITVEDLHQYKSFKLINAMLNFDELEELPVDRIIL